jgi:hypothetical protein
MLRFCSIRQSGLVTRNQDWSFLGRREGEIEENEKRKKTTQGKVISFLAKLVKSRVIDKASG